MAKKLTRTNGVYHYKGKSFKIRVGSRPQVWHGNAIQTPGGLTKDQLLMNKNNRIVSRKKHDSAKREKRLEKAGYFTKKGQFGYVKKDSKRAKTAKKGRKGKKGKKA
jgi:hypothetical protein